MQEITRLSTVNLQLTALTFGAFTNKIIFLSYYSLQFLLGHKTTSAG